MRALPAAAAVLWALPAAGADVYVVNASRVPDAEVASVAAAIDLQVRQDVGPSWGILASVRFVKGDKVPHGAWYIRLEDSSPPEERGHGGLEPGYHLVPEAGAAPHGYVFIDDNKRGGLRWTVSLSHEILEVLSDPYGNAGVLDPATGRVYRLEICDPVEGEALAYQKAGVWVSDFVLPEWYRSGPPGRRLSFAGGAYESFVPADGYIETLRAKKEWRR